MTFSLMLFYIQVVTAAKVDVIKSIKSSSAVISTVPGDSHDTSWRFLVNEARERVRITAVPFVTSVME